MVKWSEVSQDIKSSGRGAEPKRKRNVNVRCNAACDEREANLNDNE